MKGFAKDVLGVIAFFGLMAVTLLLLGLQGSGNGLAGWAVSLLGSAAFYGLILWVYRTKVGKKSHSGS